MLFYSFIATTLIFVAVPGPSVAFASAQAVRYGTRAMLITVAGDALGTTVHIIIAAASLKILIGLSEIILPFLQMIGGAFLIFMALQSFKSHGADHTVVMPSEKATFWAGFFTCVTNPKAIAFFMALFPAFLSSQHSIVLQSAVYGAVFLVLDGLSIIAFALIAIHAVKRVTARWMRVEVLSGLGLLGVGVGMIVKGYRSIPKT